WGWVPRMSRKLSTRCHLWRAPGFATLHYSPPEDHASSEYRLWSDSQSQIPPHSLAEASVVLLIENLAFGRLWVGNAPLYCRRGCSSKCLPLVSLLGSILLRDRFEPLVSSF